MKNKLIIISILITIFLLGMGVYFTVRFNRGTIKPEIQNNKSESIESKTKINDNKNNKSVFPLTNEDFVIKDKDNYIELGGKYEDLRTNEKIIETESPNQIRAYFVYIFKNFKIVTNGFIIDSIDLTTPILQTSRGIRIGDTISEVFEKYGKADTSNTEDEPASYMYWYNGKSITFFIDEIGKVDGIDYGM